MKVFYAAHYGHGTTSRMRGEYLKKILAPAEFIVADTDIPVAATSRLFRSLGWRYYKGPLIKNVSDNISRLIRNTDHFDLAWIDKGVFVKPDVLRELRRKSNYLIHYTPDCAFFLNRSNLFYEGISLYDYCITTKSFEINLYQQKGARKVLFCTQGYDPHIHYPRVDFESKDGLVFVGLCEPSREELIGHLINHKIKVRVAGKKWDEFAHKHKDNPYFEFAGSGVFGDAYAKMISESYICLGLLSKKFPELHTTRTFEVPACGTLLATESNDEIRQYFDDSEVLYFRDKQDLAEKLTYFLANPEIIRQKIQCASDKMNRLKVDYEHIMQDLLKRMEFH